MITRFITIAMFLLTVTTTRGQKIPAPTLSAGEAKDFLHSLNTPVTDTTRIDVLLQLANYNILKSGSYKADLDSAAAFIQQANALNDNIKSVKLDGYITLIMSTLSRARRDMITGKEQVNRSIRILESANDPFHLVMAKLELLSYANVKDTVQYAEITRLMPAIFLHLESVKNRGQQTDCIYAIEHFYQIALGELDLDTKLSFLNDFLAACRTIRQGHGEVWVRKEIADMHLQQGKAKEAENELLELLKFQKAGGYQHICFTYDLLSGVYFIAINYNKALYYALETIKSVSSATDSAYLPDFYYRIIDIYNQLEKFELAYYWSMKKIDYQSLTGSTDFYYDVCELIIVHLISTNKPEEALSYILDKKKKYPPQGIEQEKLLALAMARCYNALKNNLLTEKYCQQIVKLWEIEKHPTDISALSFIVEFYLGTGQYERAKKFLKPFLKELPPSAGTYRDIYTSQYMSEIDAASGNYFSAFKHLKRYHYLNDSLFNSTKNKQIEELRISYETDLKEDSIKLKDNDISLLKHQNDLQQANLKQSAFIKKITLAGIILALVFILLLYRQYRHKQKSNNLITQKNQQLQHYLIEKEWLLKEIHHRVKNNLQIVMSLLESQSVYIDNEPALTAIHDSQHRVYAMSLIHQKLYNTENLSSIDMSVYIRELSSYLADCYTIGQRIRFELSIEPLEMDVSQAVPLGLILNEAITNSIKYAFPDSKEGVIKITLSNTSADQYLLEISDNGIGMPSPLTNKKAGSLGMSLMAGLSEDLDGSFSIENKNGTILKIFFVHTINVRSSATLNTSPY